MKELREQDLAIFSSLSRDIVRCEISQYLTTDC